MKTNPTDKITEIIIHHLDGSITPDEQKELNDWMRLFPEKAEAVAEFLDEKKLQAGIKDMYQYRQKVWNVVERQVKTTKIVSINQTSSIRKFRWRMAAAAAILILLVTGGYFYFFNNSSRKIEIAKATDVNAPKSNRAMITLADGQKVYLDSADNGTLAQQGNIKLIKLNNGQIVYQTATGDIIKEIQYNTLTNPRGSKVIDMSLADGSHVWLNAGSSLTYPVSFVGSDRKVSIAGEAYFEVAHDASKPFIVSKGETSVQVLGTHFNVNAFDDESAIKVTLLEGSVKINNAVIIKPGQQAQISSEIKVASNINMDEVMSWKEGFFHFESADLKTILKEFSRWYDVEVVYEGTVPSDKFFVIMNRNSTLASVLKALQASGIKFHIEGKKLTVEAG